MLKSLLPPLAPQATNGDFRIGDWIVSPSRNRIRRRDQRVGRSVEPLLIRFLDALAKQPGQTITKDELFDRVWGGVIVSDEAMAQAASRLRKVLGDDPRHPQYVETVRKLGYRLAQPAEAWTETRRRTSRLVFAAAAGAVIAGLAAYTLLSKGGPDGSYQLTPVATDALDERKPAISPDGRQIAYEVVAPEGGTSIWFSNGSSGDAVMVPATAGAEAPVWLSNRTLGMQVRRGQDCRVMAIDLGYPGTREIGRCDGSGYADLAVSPDGRRLAFNGYGRDSAGPRALQLMEIGGAARRVTSPPAGSWGDYDPNFSPDGRTLLFTRAVSEGQQDLYLLGSDGRERRLTRRFGNLFGSTWLDSHTIIYSARSGGRFALRRLDLAKGEDGPLPLGITDAVDPVAHGKSLLIESRRFHLRLVSTVDATIPNSSGLNLHPALSPDGRKLVFTSDRSGALELWLFDRAGKRLTRLTHHNGPFVGTPRFAPDGMSIAYEVRTGDDADLHLLDLRTRRSRTLATGDYFDTAPSISADGRWVLFGSNRQGGWNLYRLPISGAGKPQLVLAGVFAGIESADGTALYFTRRDRPGLFRRDSRTGQVSVIHERFAIEDWGAFVPVGKGVLLAERLGSQRTQIVLVNHDGSTKVMLSPAGPVPSHDPVLAARSDLSEIIYAESDLGSGDIYRASR